MAHDWQAVTGLPRLARHDWLAMTGRPQIARPRLPPAETVPAETLPSPPSAGNLEPYD